MSPAAERLAQVANAYVASSALNAMIRLGVADELGTRELAVTELSQKTGTHADSLLRVLRLLSSLGIFEEVSDKTFANNESSHMLRADFPQSQRDMLLFIGDPFHFQAYNDMLPTLRDGQTAVKHVWGKEVFEVFADDAAEQARFDNAMTNFTHQSAQSILEAYDFSKIGSLVDVAGGHGALLTAILEMYPEMRGILFDLPHVALAAETRIKRSKVSDRCQAVGGDFFKEVPAAEAIIMKHIIHDWDDERALAILRNCHRALKDSPTGKLLLVEVLLSGRNEPDMSKFLDVEMMMLPGGRERTEAEYGQLFERARFKLSRVVKTSTPHVILEAVPEA